ncbi:biotin--[acetyl-CoA-carboxylase] ligase [Sphingomonas sp. So64.6b]|uniref:biotin--[acetyl-CoA-carboxylase] ligase n=1 Tax=Sphingomonas sp. So64.6b TaxID=2997354 RepID=UPI001FCEB149|nr:biotin--[acetyl-CoA-carboxylase] ligase [Sphingomonas sp. So64.6b]
MLALARSGIEEGVWLRAERQNGGRGRQGRAWASPVGNLYTSTLVRLRASDPQAATLALVTAVALEEVVRAYLPPRHSRESENDVGKSQLQLKWPNDLLLDGAKLSGILLEGAGNAVVIGIGVNLAHHPTDLDRPAASLAAHGVTPDPADFLDTLAEAFALWLARWRGEGLAPIRARWLERAHAPGTALTARLPDGSATDGLFAGLDSDGALILRLADGTTRVIHAADVFLI